jgi:maltose O-acetyltransferase
MFSDVRAVNRQGFFDNMADYIVAVAVHTLPHLPAFCRLKAVLMQMRGARVGRRVKVLGGVWIDRFSRLAIGDDVSLAYGVVMTGAGGIRIGSRSMVGYGAKILTVDHVVPPGRGSMRFSGAELKPVDIGEDVWIGAGAVVLPGATVGDGAIVGANAVVTRDVRCFAVVGGVPAVELRQRD